MVSVGVGVYRAIEAAKELSKQNIKSDVIDLRSVSPLDKETVLKSVSKTKRLIVIDEDYKKYTKNVLDEQKLKIILIFHISHRGSRIEHPVSLPNSTVLRYLPNNHKFLKSVFTFLV